MDWHTLEHEFEQWSKEGDWDAEWCYDPSAHSHQRWELVGDGGFEASSTFAQMLVTSGRLLHQAAQNQKGIVPLRLFSGNAPMADAWLNALRHFRINVQQSEPRGLRRDEGRIVDVAHASVQLCVRLRVHRCESVRDAHSDDRGTTKSRPRKLVLDLTGDPVAT